MDPIFQLCENIIPADKTEELIKTKTEDLLEAIKNNKENIFKAQLYCKFFDKKRTEIIGYIDQIKFPVIWGLNKGFFLIKKNLIHLLKLLEDKTNKQNDLDGSTIITTITTLKKNINEIQKILKSQSFNINKEIIDEENEKTQEEFDKFFNNYNKYSLQQQKSNNLAFSDYSLSLHDLKN